MQQDECCCGPSAKTSICYLEIERIGEIDTPVGTFPVVPTTWSWRDHLGTLSVRFGYGRMDYAVKPGLYSIGRPTQDSPVLVSANYKLSFDVLRGELSGLDCWILVLDTKGVNVWCAAGKGTFGTAEIIRMVKESELAHVVSHRELILPQLGAPGVSAHAVERQTGFAVTYGPVRASDIRAFLANGMVATKEMRQVTFGLADRLSVSLMELTEAGKKGFLISLVLWLLLSFGPAGFQLSYGWHRAGFAIIGLWTAILTGTVLTAALLPILPGRMFSLKGAFAGLLSGVLLAAISKHFRLFPVFPVPAASLILLIVAISAYLAMNFTGASTFTSLSGVKKEIKCSMPWITSAAVLSAGLQILRLFLIL
ncbi:MAG: mercury methylation corrinoid protein HgcA [Candidatus Edwardsbacteria bacterium]|nr:mercury methylation corrinoid protein HgcA [Candidatus Edwardsbacteria bacterium]